MTGSTTLKDRFEAKPSKAKASAFMKARPAFWRLWEALVEDQEKSPELSIALMEFNKALGNALDSEK